MLDLLNCELGLFNIPTQDIRQELRDFGVSDYESQEIFLKASTIEDEETQRDFVNEHASDEGEACCIINALEFARDKGLV